MDTNELKTYFEGYLEGSRSVHPNISRNITVSYTNMVENFDEVFTAITISGEVTNEWLCETVLLLSEKYPRKTICWEYNPLNQVVIELHDSPTNPGEVYDTVSSYSTQG